MGPLDEEAQVVVEYVFLGCSNVTHQLLRSLQKIHDSAQQKAIVTV